MQVQQEHVCPRAAKASQLAASATAQTRPQLPPPKFVQTAIQSTLALPDHARPRHMPSWRWKGDEYAWLQGTRPRAKVRKNLATLLKPYWDSAHNTQGKSRNGGGVNPHKCKCGSCLAPLLVLTSAIGCGLKAASASSLLVLVSIFSSATRQTMNHLLESNVKLYHKCSGFILRGLH